MLRIKSQQNFWAGVFFLACGVFDREMPDSDRVRILLNTVSFQAHIVVDRAVVKKVIDKQAPALKRMAAGAGA